MKAIELLQTYLSDKTTEQKLEIWHAFKLLVERDELLEEKLTLEADLANVEIKLNLIKTKIEGLK